MIRFSGIDNPEAAALLGGAELIAGRENAAPLREGEYYVEDLKGLSVVNSSGEELGKIADVIEGGNGYIAEVICAAGEKKYIPFRNEFFGDIFFSDKKIVLVGTWILDEKNIL